MGAMEALLRRVPGILPAFSRHSIDNHFPANGFEKTRSYAPMWLSRGSVFPAKCRSTDLRSIPTFSANCSSVSRDSSRKMASWRATVAGTGGLVLGVGRSGSSGTDRCSKGATNGCSASIILQPCGTEAPPAEPGLAIAGYSFPAFDGSSRRTVFVFRVLRPRDALLAVVGCRFADTRYDTAFPGYQNVANVVRCEAVGLVERVLLLLKKIKKIPPRFALSRPFCGLLCRSLEASEHALARVFTRSQRDGYPRHKA